MAPKTEEPWFINKSPTFIGPAPWSDTGAYTVNATLQAGGRPFAIVNVGNKVKTNIPPGAMIPYSQIHSIDNKGEENGTWTLVINTNDNPEFYANMVEQAGVKLRYQAAPQAYSKVPLIVHYKVDYDVVTHGKPIAGSNGRSQKMRNHHSRTATGSIHVPAGQVQDLGYLIRVDIEKAAPTDIDKATGLRKQDSYIIARQLTLAVGLKNGA